MVFDINGEFITEITREWFHTGEKSYETIMEILMDSMTGTDKPEAQIRRYAEDILLGRAALKGGTAAGTYHLEIYEPGEEEQMPQRMNIWKEIERRKKIEKEQTHYQTAYEKLLKQLESSPDDADLIQKKSELETQLQDIDKAMKDIDYREANQRAGYVYIISNIGAFGENVYKIGMTRRLDPQDRVDELGDASVPFNFDVHAMIFSDDAPALEAALHKAFEDRKLNMVNTRREFFNVTLDEIKEVVKKNFDKTVEFIDVADAEQYRISQKMKHQSK